VVPVAGGVDHFEDAFEGSGSVRIFEQRWRPSDANVRAAVVLVHGLKDHSTRYAEVADRLAQRGYAVHAYDLRGHGSSGGRRAYVESFDEYIADLDTFVGQVKQLEPTKPVFVLGHDMGATIALEWVLQKKPDIAGLVVSGASLHNSSSGFRQFVTRAAGTVLPLLALLSVDVDHLSQDPAVVQACKTDPLVEHGNGPARTARELLRAMDFVDERESQVRVPILILHGGADVLSTPAVSRELYGRVGSADKALHVYDGMFHDLWREPARAKVMQDLSDWLDLHVALKS
jgi:alpha-beta hydrolase superfamily lysophospholipase